MIYSFPKEILSQHIAILGKTGSGKTSTEKLVIEQAFAEGFRVCILDTSKSDWWGITSSADGRRPGLPFKILGGPRGHVPMHSSAGKAIGQLVGVGKLPHSIIDMADFEPGGIQRFFVDFVQALWKHARGVIYLVIEEAHEVAPKERVGFGAENMSIHWAKKLATAGRTKGIRLVVASQRAQSLHNAVLGSCETLIAHRITLDADQKPVRDWLKNAADKATLGDVAASLGSLPTGTGWICSGESKLFEKVTFPKFATYDNTATPTGDGADIEVKTAPVNHDELRAIIGDAVKEAEADDPKVLRAEIAKLKAELTKGPTNITKNITAAEIEESDRRGYARGRHDATLSVNRAIALFQQAWDVMTPNHARLQDAYVALVDTADAALQAATIPTAVTLPPLPPPRAAAPPNTHRCADHVLSGPERQILDSLTWWESVGHMSPTNEQVAWLAGYSPSGGAYRNPRGRLRANGLVSYPADNCVSLTTEGGRSAVIAEFPGSILDFVLSRLSGPEQRILQVIASHAGPSANQVIADGAGYAPDGGAYRNPRGSLRSKGLIIYPAPDHVALVDWLRTTK